MSLPRNGGCTTQIWRFKVVKVGKLGFKPLDLWVPHLPGMASFKAPKWLNQNQGCSQHPKYKGGNLVDKVVKWPISLSCGYNLHTMDWSNHENGWPISIKGMVLDSRCWDSNNMDILGIHLSRVHLSHGNVGIFINTWGGRTLKHGSCRAKNSQ